MILTLQSCLEQHTWYRARYVMLVGVSAFQRHGGDGDNFSDGDNCRVLNHAR